LQEYDGLDEDFSEPYDEYAWKNINSTVKKEDEFLNEEKPKPKKRYYKPKNKKK
jgi:hypothetical protein